MRRLPLILIAALALSGCYTHLKQTRAPVSADCGSWPAPVDEGQVLTLKAGEVGKFETLNILFADMRLNVVPPYRYRYVRPGWYGVWYPAPEPVPMAPVDEVYLSICSSDGAPVDRKFYLSDDPWRVKDTADIGPYHLRVSRLRVRHSEATGDSLATDDDRDMREQGLITLVVSRES